MNRHIEERGGAVAVSLRAVSVHAGIGRARKVLVGPIDLEIAPGEAISIVGPSGAGKSSLLRLVAGLVEPTEGEIDVIGPTTAPVSIGFVPQTPALLPWLTLLENVALPVALGPHARRTADAFVKAAAEQELKRFGLADAVHALPGMLSGGMQSRGALARALVGSPELLLLDEPFSSVDSVTAETIMIDLARSRGKATAILVSHDLLQAAFMCDRIVVLSPPPGRIVGEVRIDAPHPRPPEFLEDAALAEAVTKTRKILREGDR